MNVNYFKTLWKSSLMILLFCFGLTSLWGQTTVNFDSDDNWTNSGTITSYGNHSYAEGLLNLQLSNALRNTTTAQDGFAGALGTYSIRLRDQSTTQALFTIATGGVGEFSFKVRRWDGSPMPNYTVEYSINNGVNWTSVTNIDGTLLTNSDWKTYGPISINSANNNIQIRVKNTGTTERIMIDDFAWTGFSATPCDEGTLTAGTTVSNVEEVTSGGSANLSLDGASTGTGLSYQWQSSTNGTDWSDIDGATSATYSATNITAATYFRAAVTCGETTEISTPILINVIYCTPTADSNDNTGITQVSFSNLNNTAGGSAETYTDFTNLIADVIAGEYYNLTVNVNTGGNFTVQTKAWIDWDKDYAFEVSEEYDLGSANNVTNGATSNSPLSINIPSDIAVGTYRMRIRTTYNTAPTACGSQDYTETEDYTVNIVAAGPVLTADPTTITGLQAIENSAASTPTSFTVTGTNLDGSDVTITADGVIFEISETEAGTYTDEITLTAYDGTAQTIWVRLAANQTEGLKNEIILIHGGGADDIEVTVSGEVLSSDPILTVSEEEIVNLGYTFGAATSVPASFTISGLNMDGSGDVMLAFENLDTDFEMSLAADGTYTDDLLIEDYDGTETTIYVRLKSGLAIGAAYSDVLEIVTDYDVNGSVLVFAEVTAPIINTNPDTIVPAMTAIAGETDTETVTVSGTLTADVTAQITGDDAGQFSVTASVTSAGGDLTVTYQPTTVGEHTATLVLSTNGGVTKELALSGTATLGIPVATAATLIGQDSFTANWEAVMGATSYEIDVYTMESNIVEILNEEFTWNENGTGGNDGNWSGNIASATTGLTEHLLNWSQDRAYKGDNCIKMGSANNQGVLTTPALGFIGNGTLTFRAGAWDATNEQTKLKLEISGGGNLSATEVTMTKGAFTSYEVQITEATANTKITFKGFQSSNSRFFLDDVKVMGETQVNTPIAGSPFTVSAPDTSYEVTSLDSETTYYYVVRAVAGEETSVNSNQVEVETLEAPAAIVWTTDNEWSNETGPTITDDVIIEGDLTLTGNLSAKTLTVADGGKITVPANKVLTVDGAIINEAGAANFVVENDGILIQNTDAENTGAITVERNSNPMFRLDYTLWSSPVAGMRLVDFSNVSPTSPTAGEGTLWNRVYTLGEAAWEQVWNSQPDFENDTTPFIAGQGYLYRSPNLWVTRDSGNPATAYEGIFNGVPNNGNITATTPYEFSSIGNPYPSPIDAEEFITNNDVEFIYFWTNTHAPVNGSYDNQPNNWAYFSAVAGGVSADGGALTPNGIIQPGQGFVAKMLNSSESVTFNNTMRTNNTSGLFFRAMNTERHRFWLNLSNEEVVFNQILVGYMDNATQGVDTGIDAEMFAYEGNALYSIIENSDENYVIQGRSLPFTASDVVALGFRAVNAGSFTISLNNVDGLFANNQNIYLKDNFTQLLHNLKEGAYTFVSEEGIFNTRFEVVYQTTMSVENPIANNANWIVYSQENGYQIQTQGFELKSVQVFDLLGRAIYTASAEGTAHHIPSLGADSVYIVKVTTTDNVVLSKKVR